MSRNQLQIDRNISTIPLGQFQSKSDNFFEDALEGVYIGDKSDEFIRGLVSGYYTSFQLIEQNQKDYIFHILCFLSKRVKK